MACNNRIILSVLKPLSSSNSSSSKLSVAPAFLVDVADEMQDRAGEDTTMFKPATTPKDRGSLVLEGVD